MRSDCLPPPVTGWDGYRPHLDGLRAFAVYLVVLFHAGSGWFSGGYIGVDVFFVLSGFLVTQLLLRDVTRPGSIRFGRFYSRRFRRLAAGRVRGVDRDRIRVHRDRVAGRGRSTRSGRSRPRSCT